VLGRSLKVDHEEITARKGRQGPPRVCDAM
jgi:hypothetical protein